jgi:hypothetical protein
MRAKVRTSLILAGVLLFSFWGMPALLAAPAAADTFFFSTGNPDGRMATASRPDSGAGIEIESADDFILKTATQINSATFTGLIPSGATVDNVDVEIYRVFPKDSTFPPNGAVTTRANSPSDVEFADRNVAHGNMTFTTTTLSPSFKADNSVLNGIHPLPNEATGGEGPVTGEEVRFNADFTTPFVLPADHYFFVPQVLLNDSNNFFWLSAPKPIVAPGTPFIGDLQEWIRNADLDPNWLRVGTDILDNLVPPPVPQFNATFSLTGVTVPEPSTVWLLTPALVALGGMRWVVRRRRPDAALEKRSIPA